MSRRWELIARERFLGWRHESYDAAIALWKREGSPKNRIILKLPGLNGDEVVCDLCNDTIEDKDLSVFMVGSEPRRCHCSKCPKGDW